MNFINNRLSGGHANPILNRTAASMERQQFQQKHTLMNKHIESLYIYIH